jgi:Tfp pilus assembly protein PilF
MANKGKGKRKRLVRPGLVKKPLEPRETPQLVAAQLAQLELAEAYLSGNEPAMAQKCCERVLQTKPLSQAWRERAEALLAQSLLALGDTE